MQMVPFLVSKSVKRKQKECAFMTPKLVTGRYSYVTAKRSASVKVTHVVVGEAGWLAAARLLDGKAVMSQADWRWERMY